MGVETVAPLAAMPAWDKLELKNVTFITSDWPVEVRGDLCWDSSTFGSLDHFTLFLDSEDQAEVETALCHFKGTWFRHSSQLSMDD